MRFYTPMRSARRPAAAEIEPRGGVARSAWPRCSPPAPCTHTPLAVATRPCKPGT